MVPTLRRAYRIFEGLDGLQETDAEAIEVKRKQKGKYWTGRTMKEPVLIGNILAKHKSHCLTVTLLLPLLKLLTNHYLSHITWYINCLEAW